ncbi:MAG: phage holin family protein [Rhodocyclaceae bacterium]|nr:phage holin family protein [Rhodocyclaceae bacterium]MBX3669516.1 phage holin family protein [Rhodocyclaceae bacterium]
MQETPPEQHAPDSRLGVSLRRFAQTSVELLHNRLALLTVEWQEEKRRIGLFVGYALAAMMLLGFGLLFVAVLITVALWDTNRLFALGVGAAVLLTAGVFCALTARQWLSKAAAPFAATLEELQHDRDRLAGKGRE